LSDGEEEAADRRSRPRHGATIRAGWRYPAAMANVIDYVELAVDDLEAAKVFYAQALGWAFTDYGSDYVGIQDPRNPGQEFGGLNPVTPSSRGDGVLALARTDDAEAALASVKEAGGRIQVDLHEYPGGRRFTFVDPWGNILGVYEPSD
jgi:predicted enzyme related to lactoylglutathione lyase